MISLEIVFINIVIVATILVKIKYLPILILSNHCNVMHKNKVLTIKKHIVL